MVSMLLDKQEKAPWCDAQRGGVTAWLLWPLALLGLITAVLIVIAVKTWQPQPLEQQAKAASASTEITREVKVLSAERQATFDRTCHICHGSKGTGAPMTGDHAAWDERLAKGIDKLLDHTVNGNGGMPPMGMCMECEQTDFVAFIEYMGEFDSGLECE